MYFILKFSFVSETEQKKKRGSRDYLIFEIDVN